MQTGSADFSLWILIAVAVLIPIIACVLDCVLSVRHERKAPVQVLSTGRVVGYTLLGWFLGAVGILIAYFTSSTPEEKSKALRYSGIGFGLCIVYLVVVVLVVTTSIMSVA